MVTSFLVQVSQSLQADYTAMSAILLYDLVAVQLSIAAGPSSLLNITAPSVNPMQTFRPDSITVWVNGLWVVSLAMSLVVALSAVLVKQWLHHYTAIPSGTPGDRSHLRQYRFDGLKKWRVSVIIGTFPIIMHTSLALFLTGLMIFFIPLRTSLACALGVITIVLCLLYLVSSALPIFFPQCPYQTPLTDFIHHTCLAVSKATTYAQRLILHVVPICRRWIHHPVHFNSHFWYRGRVEPRSSTLKQLELTAVKSNYDKLSVDALDWLYNVSSNPTGMSLVIQAVGGLPPEAEMYARETWEARDAKLAVTVHTRLIVLAARDLNQDFAIENRTVLERLTRSLCFFSKLYDELPERLFTVPDEPRLTAAAWAADTDMGISRKPIRDLRKFFCTFSELPLHPLIWVKLVQYALGVHSESDKLQYHCFQTASLEDLPGQEYAHIISLFLPASRYSPIKGLNLRWVISQSSRTATLREALTYHLGDISEPVQDCLLNMLSSFDDDLSATLPPCYRLLYNAGRYALPYVVDEFWVSYIDGESCCHLELLGTVLHFLNDEYCIIQSEYPYFLAPIFDMICTLIDNTSLCDYKFAGWHDERLHDLVAYCIMNIMCLLKEFVSSCRPEFAFLSFHRLLQVPAQYLSEGQCFSITLSIGHTLGLMERALFTGNEAMYRTFVDGGWMGMLSEMWIANFGNRTSPSACNSYHSPIFAFIEGLQTLCSTSALEFFDYARQPRNFIAALLVVAFGPDEYSRDSSWLDTRTLLKTLCPRDSSWLVTHRATLDGIIDWCQASNRDDLPFPLENLFNGKVVHNGERVVSLDEALREMFALDSNRLRFDWAARTMILGEAAPDPPLMPWGA